MPQFTVRVELHHATWTDYEALHSAMATKGFSRQITSDEGKTYQLPLAEYNASANLTASEVRDIARTAANTTGKQSAVLVTAGDRAWVGLQQTQWFQEKKRMAKQPGLDNRSRDNNGQTRAKNGNTLVGTLRQTYSDNFAEGRRSDLKLENLLEQTGNNSLSEYLRNQKS
jgi:Endoribonuclease GhoS